MGWMTWMYYTTEINEGLIRDVADTMASGGYLQAGYRVISIDDGWTTSRDPVTNALVADPIKFPSGIPALVSYVNAKGLELGIYADVGSLTCGGYSGLGMDANLTSKQYIKDVEQFASWGIYSLKVDGCYEDPSIMNITYPALSNAINATGHPMWLSCSWPCYVGGCGGGMAKVGARVYSQLQQTCNTWRDFNDIYDNIDSLYNVLGAYTNPDAIALHNAVNQPGSWSDADMLVAGAGGLSLVEETMQMVMWAMFSSPLMMSNPLRDIPEESKALLLNTEIIGINQDTSNPGTFNVTDDHTYCKNLEGGKIALAGIHQTSLGPPTLIVLSPNATDRSSRLSNCLLPIHARVKEWTFRDNIMRLDMPSSNGTYVECLAGQPGVCLVTATPVF
jgi:alpha-N-acetylgalactosaminidase